MRNDSVLAHNTIP